MPKTATKTLQWRLFSQHSEVFYLGRFDGPQFRKKHQRLECCRDATVQKVMQQIAYEKIFHPDLDECRRLMRHELKEANEKNLVPVWSWESYATDVISKRRVRASNLKRVFGEATILMVLRHPLVLLESAYFQQLKRDNVSPKLKLGSPPYYQSMDDWLRSGFEEEILPHLQYGQTVQAFTEQFGIDHVHVFLFEDLVADEQAFFHRICSVMQIDPEEGVRLIQGERDNERWTVRQLEILRGIVDSPVRTWMFRMAPHSVRLRWLGLESFGTPIHPGQKARAPISDHWKVEIFKAAEPGNRWLEQHFGLPLTKHGYLGEGAA
jgi:hypothetical protein